jgi:hypothetical protein
MPVSKEVGQKKKIALKFFLNIKVICKGPRLGGEFGQFDPDRTRNQKWGLKFIQMKLTWSEIEFCTDFGAQTSFL